jgi:hypothetical protein
VLTPAGLAMALRSVLRPCYPAPGPAEAPVLAQDTLYRRRARHGRTRAGLRPRTTLVRPAA